MDMVCQADDQIQIDFTKDPIIPRIDGKYLKATHTSLGADDGMGIATCFAILADKTVKHGPLEVQEGFVTKQVVLNNFVGGHSGCDIHLGRANPMHVMGRLLAVGSASSPHA